MLGLEAQLARSAPSGACRWAAIFLVPLSVSYRCLSSAVAGLVVKMVVRMQEKAE